MLSERQRDDWTNNGFFLLNGFVERPITDELLHAAEEMADRVDAGLPIGDAYTALEPGKSLSAQLSKISRTHRTKPVFRHFAGNSRTLDPIVDQDCAAAVPVLMHAGDALVFTAT